MDGARAAVMSGAFAAWGLANPDSLREVTNPQTLLLRGRHGA